MFCERQRKNMEHGNIGVIEFVLDKGMILHMSEIGVYILKEEDIPLTIPMGEKKLMIRDYESLFDGELIVRYLDED